MILPVPQIIEDPSFFPLAKMIDVKVGSKLENESYSSSLKHALVSEDDIARFANGKDLGSTLEVTV